MSNRAIFAIMGALAAAALVGLWFLVKGDPEGVETTPSRGSQFGTETKNSGFTGAGHGPAQAPALPQTGSSGLELPEKVKQYAANGAIISDHRTGSRGTFEPADNPAPPNGRKLDPTLTKAIADRVRDVMHDCVKTLPTEARGEKPRLEGSINIAIKAKQVSINRADLRVQDVNGDAAETVKQCIVGKSASITQTADVADLESYDINLSFNLI